jgi:lysyl-tRNA synthetase, class II
MASLSELRTIRLEKLEKLRALSMEPFASSVTKTHDISEIESEFSALESSKAVVSICGRVLAIRGQGAIMFAQIFDGTARFQVVIKQDMVGDEAMTHFAELVDMGDFVEFTGICETTQKGQPSVFATGWKMLTKSLLPLPDKYHGIQDDELAIRQRYLDMATNPEVFNRFVIRSKTISYIRNYLDAKNFLEIETPILENQAGGAMARTFNTFHNDYQMPMVMRIAVELSHKIVTASGMQRVYEFAKTFRNEGSDPTHLQEFTMLEWYAAYESLETNMRWTEEMLRGVARDVVGKTIFTVYDKSGNGVEVDFEKEWPRVRFPDLLKQNANFDMFAATDDEIRAEAIKWGMEESEAAKTGKGNLLDHIFKKSTRCNIIHPTFVLDYPSDLKPLAQQNGDGTAKVYQLIMGGAELNNAYAELVDPLIQRELLEAQAAAKAGGDEEAMQVDERFLTAMEQGMPPMTGFGMGIDRLVAILTDQKNIRDVVLFPITKSDE